MGLWPLRKLWEQPGNHGRGLHHRRQQFILLVPSRPPSLPVGHGACQRQLNLAVWNAGGFLLATLHPYLYPHPPSTSDFLLQVGYDSSAHIAEETKNAAIAGACGG